MKFSLPLLAALIAPIAAQTWTSCNPLNSTCPSDQALGQSWNQTFDKNSELDTDVWNITAGEPGFGNKGAVFSITQPQASVTAQTQFYIFFGRVEVMMQAATGRGIISSIVMLSDDLDEIDWEIMGGNTTHVETNYYGKGNATQINSKYYECDSPQGKMHNYTWVWTQDLLEWHLDGQVVRSLPYGEAVGAGKFYPQTPSYLKLGIWPAGDKHQPKGTIAWAGGEVDYSDGPFSMYVQSVKITDHQQKVTTYSYGDHSGSFESIKMEKNGESKVTKAINAPPPLTAAQRWAGLSSGAKIAIIVCPLALLAVLAVVGCFCCLKQRKLGRRERAQEDAAWEKENAEMMAYRKQMAAGHFAQGSHRAAVAAGAHAMQSLGGRGGQYAPVNRSPMSPAY